MKGLSLDTYVSNKGIQESGGSRVATSLPIIQDRYDYKVFMANICHSSIGHTFGSEIRTFQMSSISSTDLMITSAIDSFGSISPGSQELNCPSHVEISGTEKSLINMPTRCSDIKKAWIRATRTEKEQRVDIERSQDLETMQDDVVVEYVAKQVKAAMKDYVPLGILRIGRRKRMCGRTSPSWHWVNSLKRLEGHSSLAHSKKI